MNVAAAVKTTLAVMAIFEVGVNIEKGMSQTCLQSSIRDVFLSDLVNYMTYLFHP